MHVFLLSLVFQSALCSLRKVNGKWQDVRCEKHMVQFQRSLACALLNHVKTVVSEVPVHLGWLVLTAN